MAEACDKLRLFLTFSCFTHMLAISFAPRAVIHRRGDTFPLPLRPARAALCLSTASHKSASSLSSRQSDRSPPPPKAETPRCRGALPHRFPLALPLFPAPGFDFVTRTGQAGLSPPSGLSRAHGDFLGRRNLAAPTAARVLPTLSRAGGTRRAGDSP